MVCWVCAVCNNENSHYLDKCDVCHEPGNPQKIELARKKAAIEHRREYERAMLFYRAEKIRRRKIALQINVALICNYVLSFLKAASRILIFIFILSMACMIKEIGFSMDADSRATYMSAVLENVQILIAKPYFFSHNALLLKKNVFCMLLSMQNLADMVSDTASLIIANYQVLISYISDSKKYEPLKESLLFLFDVTETNNGLRNLLFLFIHNMKVFYQIVLGNITKFRNMFR